MAGSFVPFSGVSSLKQEMGVGEGVSVGVDVGVFVAVDAGVWVEVGVKVEEEVTGMPRARPQAARKVAVRLVMVNLRKSRRERFLF
jgi:tetrahydrodipicolinate N-succinyltransferase